MKPLVQTRLLLSLLTVLYLFTRIINCDVSDPQTVHELQYAQQLLTDEISMIKNKILLDVFLRINEVEKKLDFYVNSRKIGGKDEEESGKGCSCENTVDEEERNRYVALYNAFVEEKAKTNKLLDAITKIEDNAKSLYQWQLSIESSLDLLKADHKTILGVEKRLRYFRQPSYTSDWTLMKAQSAQESQARFKHGLREIPYKVEVQIRPEEGPNAGWLFHGDSVFQVDDDKHLPYGGIVYLYNDEEVVLVAPKKNNNGDQGVIINTGGDGNFRVGDFHQKSMTARVRVKVWGTADFPRPDFMTSWKPLDIKDSELTYYEVEHTLGEYPALINFQLMCKDGSSFMISEGVGATVSGSAWDSSGGVVWAFDKNVVRVWTGFRPSSFTGEKVSFPHLLLGNIDGWNYPNSCEQETGSFRILAWAQTSVVKGVNFITPEFPSSSQTEQRYSHDSDLLSLYVQCEEGVNKGFRFKGYGNSQTKRPQFGGVVYAFNTSDAVRVWRPNPDKGGFMVHVASPYGNDKNLQATNNASMVTQVLKGFPLS